MKIHSLIIALLLFPVAGFSQAASSWTILNTSSVTFTIKNFGSNVDGRLSGVTGSIHYDATDLKGSKFDVKVDVSTINTENTKRDNHLKNEDFFEVETYPYITFTSTSIEKDGDGYKVTGKLKIKNVEKTVTIPFYVTQSGNKAVFKGDLEVNRVEYGVGGSSMTMGDTVTITISVSATK